MSNINVALSTTKHILAIDKGSPDDVQKMNTPVCSANIYIGLMGYGPQLEREEARLAELCKRMAKQVFIDPVKKYLFVGEDPRILETGLVEYTEKESHQYATDFFEQWEKYHAMLFEFVVLDMDGKTRFALKGLWWENKWFKLEINTKPSVKILTGAQKQWGTFSTQDLFIDKEKPN